MSRDSGLYLRDMRAACRRILDYRSAGGASTALEDGQTRDAILWNLMVLGEAAKQVPSDLTEAYPQGEWRKIAGFRNVLAHAYFGIDPTILRDVVDNKVPELLAVLERILDTD